MSFVGIRLTRGRALPTCDSETLPWRIRGFRVLSGHGHGQHNTRVVIVDDSELVRGRMVALLRELPGVDVVSEAGDVETAVNRVRELHPHVVILDVSLPDGCGLDILEVIRAERIPSMVVVVTNYSDPEYELRARRGGAVAFLDKSRDFLAAVEYVGRLAARNREVHGEDRMELPPHAGEAVVGEPDEILEMVHEVRVKLRDFQQRAHALNQSVRLVQEEVDSPWVGGDAAVRGSTIRRRHLFSDMPYTSCPAGSV